MSQEDPSNSDFKTETREEPTDALNDPIPEPWSERAKRIESFYDPEKIW